MDSPTRSDNGVRPDSPAVSSGPLDPRENFMQTLRSNRASATASASGGATPPTSPEHQQGPTSGDDGESMFGSAFSGGPSLASQLRVITSLEDPACREFIKRVHQVFGLTGSEGGLEEYRQCDSQLEANYILICALTKLQQVIEEGPATRPRYQMTTDLENTARRYAKLFLYSPRVAAYRGNNAAELVIKALRANNVADLPDPSGHDDEVLASFIRAELTTFRSQIKTKVFASLNEGSSLHNVADLTGSIIQSEGAVRPTAAMFMRAAFLRWHTVNYSSHPDWWQTVDDTLAEYKQTLSQPELELAFNAIYQADVGNANDLGNMKHPLRSSVRAVDPTTIPRWIQKIFELSKESVKAPSTKKRRYN
ncbi:hypothetical protein K525DRAFT_214140 [Schizophyllum commune Loenen D]|nr:hypothetical protein K525DRAFT_214140 [Schizophyllum commune Loenen D]